VSRGYTREAYLQLVMRAKELIPGLAITTDIISGFCGETEEEHRDTVSLMREVGYDQVSKIQASGRIYKEFASISSCLVGCDWAMKKSRGEAIGLTFSSGDDEMMKSLYCLRD